MPSVRDTVHNTPSRVNTITAHPHLRVAREPDLCFVGEAVLPAELAGLGIGIVVFGAAGRLSKHFDRVGSVWKEDSMGTNKVHETFVY